MGFGVKCLCCGTVKFLEEPKECDKLFTCEPCSDDDNPLDLKTHLIDIETSVVNLEASKAFDGLTPKEKAYAYGIAKASWEGAKICLLQTSPESSIIFTLLQLVFSAQPVSELMQAARSKGLSDLEIDQAMQISSTQHGLSLCLMFGEMARQAGWRKDTSVTSVGRFS